MVLDKLSESLRNTLKKIANAVFVDDRLINELIKEIQKALLYADCNVELVFQLTQKIKKRALEENTPSGISKREHLVKIVYDELVEFLGSENTELKITKKPFKIMLVGLFGNGKSSSAGKLAKYFSVRGNKVCAIQLDVHRPSAYEQLKILGDSINVPVFGNPNEKNPLTIYKDFENEFVKFDVVIVDTAGRDALSNDLIDEIEKLTKYIDPDEKWLVIGADIGQGAKQQAEQFHKSCKITGVVVTKLDGTAKGGGALITTAATKSPIKFISVGEKIEDLELFKPKGFVSRLLGMGDLEALLEKAKFALDEKQTDDLGKKFLKGDFNFLDLYEQMQSMSKLGPLSKIVEMIPGFGSMNIPKEMLEGQEQKLKIWKFIMQSMTKKELENPDLLDSSRIERIAKGSGLPTQEVRNLLKQYKQSKKVVKLLKGADDPEKLMKKMKGKMPKGFGL